MASVPPDGDLLLYVLAGVSYVGVGIFEKAILNWVIGPLWLLGVLTLGVRLSSRRKSE